MEGDHQNLNEWLVKEKEKQNWIELKKKSEREREGWARWSELEKMADSDDEFAK